MLESNLEIVGLNESDPIPIRVDTGHPFITDMVFKTEMEAIDWLHNVERIVGMVLVRRRSSYSHGQNHYIKLVCERGGDMRISHMAKSYIASKITGQRKLKQRSSSTKKCGCEFALILKKDKNTHDWTIILKNGIHNHNLKPSGIIPRKCKSKATDERSIKRMPSLFEYVEEATLKKKNVGVFENTDERSIKRMPSLFEYVEEATLKKKNVGVFENNVIFVHEKFREFVLDIQDVEADGNCGYRSVAVALGRPEEDYCSIRQELVNELKSNMEHYEALFRLKGHTVLHLIQSVDWKHGKCMPKYWMKTPMMLWVIAERYNAVVVLLSGGTSSSSNLTCFPTRQPPKTRPPILIGVLYRKSHYLCAKLKDDCPLPPLIHEWLDLAPRISTVVYEVWMKLFSTRLEVGDALLGRK